MIVCTSWYVQGVGFFGVAPGRETSHNHKPQITLNLTDTATLDLIRYASEQMLALWPDHA
jgi:hypothetical protein